MIIKQIIKFNKYKFKCFLHQKRSIVDAATKEEILVKQLGCSKLKASKLVRTKKLSRVDPSFIERTIKCCRKIGYSDWEILTNPRLFNINPITLEHRFMAMQEGGFCEISPLILIKFLTVIKMSVGSLKTRQLIEKDINVSKSFVNYLNPKPEGFHVESDDSDLWKEVHQRVFTEYLQWRLDGTRDEIERMFKAHPNILRKSFRHICEIINLLESFGFHPKRILKYGYVLKTYPPYTKEVIEKYGNLCDTDITKEMCHWPKLFSAPPDNFEKVYKLLKEHNISDRDIRRSMNVFCLSADTIRQRLDELNKIPDLKIFANNSRVVKLLIHHNRAKSRLNFLKKLHLKCTGMGMLVNDDDTFDIHVRQGKDSNNSTETGTFLAKLIGVSKGEIMPNFKKHPFYLHVPFVEIKETYEYLKRNGFNNNDIINVIQILLYPRDKVEESFEEIRSNGINMENLSNVKILNLALYFMEREHHFTGNGIWTKPPDEIAANG